MEKLKKSLTSFLVPILSILLAFVVGGIIMAILGADPFKAVKYLFQGAFGSVSSIGTTLSKATPLLFTSLCACFAYKCGVFNLGGEGQFLMGSIATFLFAHFTGMTGIVGIILALLVGALAGGLWGMIPGILKITRGQNEMIISIMLNYVATLFMGVLYTNWIHDASVPQTPAVNDLIRLPRVIANMRFTWGLVIAVAVGLLMYYVLFHTSKGFKLRAVGYNMVASRFSINDGGWGAACYNAMVAAAEQKGWSYEVTDSISQDQYYESMVAFCSLGYDMIYAPGNQYTDAVLQVAEEYPEIGFALLNGAESTPAKAVNGNVASLLPNAQQIGWIAGALAGLMTESGKLGFVGGMELDTTKGKIAGYEEAAKYVGEKEGKTIELLNVPYANSFSDAPKGKEFATELISQGADVFFGDASAVDSGVREAIDAANTAAGSVKIFDIAQPADILGQNPCIITSQVTDNSAMVATCMTAIEEGTFGGTTIYGTMENGCLYAGAINTELVPEAIQAKYQEYLKQMADGTFMK